MQVNKVEETSECLLAALKAVKEEVESSLSKEKLQTLQLKQDLIYAETHNSDLYKVTLKLIGIPKVKAKCMLFFIFPPFLLLFKIELNCSLCSVFHCFV